MPTWKKVVVSGSAISQLSNDLNYLAQSQTDAILSGSFSGSFVGDGSGLTNIVADGTISGSAQVTVQDTTGFSDLQSNISASFAVSSSAHTQREALISNLSGSASTQREAQKSEIDGRLSAIETFTGSLDASYVTESELASATSSLSSSAHTQRVALSASSATYTDNKVDALSGSAATALRAEYVAADSALSASQKTYIDAKVAGLVDSAPATLDTLNELAAALNDDPNFSASIATSIGNRVLTSTFNTYSGSAATALRAEYVAGDSALSSSAHTQREAVISALSSSVDTHLDANISALSGAAHTQRVALYEINSASIAALDGDFATDAELTALSSSVDAHLDANISALSASVDTHLDANISALSASVDAHLDANISALSASVDTHLDANISALSASAHTSRVALSGSQKTYIDAKVAGIVDSAPATLDTLNELAAALNDDPNFSASIATSIGNRVLTSTFNTYSSSAATALRAEYVAADSTLSGSGAQAIQDLSSSADVQRKAISASLATSIAGVQAGALVSGSYQVELKSDNGDLNFTDGLQIGDIYGQGNGTTDIYVPSGAAWVELNYGGQDYIYLDGRKAGVQIENDGTTLEWTFYGTGANAGVLNAPGDIIIPSNKEFNGGKVVVNTVTGSTNFNTIHNLPTLVSGSSQVAISDTDGYATYSASVATYTDAKIAALSASADTHLDANISALSSSVDAHLDANISALSSSVDAHLDANITALSGAAHTSRVALSGSTKTYIDAKVAGIVDSAPATLDTLNELAAALNDDPNFSASIATSIGNRVLTSTFNTYSGSAATALRAEYVAADSTLSASAAQAVQDLSGSAHTARVNLATSLYISGSTGNDEVNLKTDALSFAGEGGISVDVTDNTVTINSTDIISSSAQVVSSLNNQTVDFGTGLVTASFFKGDGSGLENITVDQNATVTSTFTSVTSHTVTHNFGTKNVIAFVYDSNDNQILPEELTTTDANNIDVTFSTSTSGRVVVARGGHIVSGSIPYANLIAVPTLVSGSSQVTVQDTDGFTDLQSNISASFAVSSSAHSQREALISALSASVDTHLDANISALSSSVDTHLDANISALSSSAHTARASLASSLILSGSTGNDTVNLKTDALSIVGTASEIETTVTNNQVAIGIVTNPTLSGNVIVTGNLTVQGDTFENQVTNLNVEDRFILLNSGSNSGDVGIIFGGSDGTANQGSGIFWDSPANVFGFSQGIGTADTSATATAKLGAITTSTSDPSATPTFQGIGSIHVNTSTEEVFIYTSA